MGNIIESESNNDHVGVTFGKPVPSKKKGFKCSGLECKERLCEQIRNNIIGAKQFFPSPFGTRKVVYADYIASGKHLYFLEDFLVKIVKPLYANVHTKGSITGFQTTQFREEARKKVFECLHGIEGEDYCVFEGQGATTCSNLLVNMIFQREDIKDKEVHVFTSIFEHHSNFLPYREKGATVTMVKESKKTGKLDLEFLENELARISKKPNTFIIGAFSAASNISGILTDTVAITKILHKYGALAFFDYACSAPYVDVQMNTKDEDGNWVKKDALFLSTHKFIGGPGTPGILMVKHGIVSNAKIPLISGGGTVQWVTEEGHVYLEDEERFEGGTPLIEGDIKAGIVFALKQFVTPKFIKSKEMLYFNKAMSILSKNKNFFIIGNPYVPRVSVMSFLVKVDGLLLHCKFVTKLLNDLFGIQSRSGCMCAGPYGVYLFGMTENETKKYEELLSNKEGKYELLKPGFCRLSFNYFISEDEFNYIVKAIDFIATHGWKFLPLYTFGAKSGNWTHITDESETDNFKKSRLLSNISYENGIFGFSIEDNFSKPDPKTKEKDLYKSYLKEAKVILKETVEDIKSRKEFDKELLAKEEVYMKEGKYRWFLTPSEAFKMMKDESFKSTNTHCFNLRQYEKPEGFKWQTKMKK